MTAEEQKRYINYLAERLEKADLGLRARDAVLQDFLDKQKEYDERLSKLDDVLSKVSSLESSLKENERKLKTAERKVADLTAKLKFADKNRFGDKGQRVKKAKSTKAEESDRGKDEDDFDGTSSSLPNNSVSKNEASSKGENLSKKNRDLSNRPETYKTMCVKGPSEEYKSDEAKPIDNNATERAVRPLTTQRNGMLHFGSDEGAKMAATYHSIISTVKLQGRSAWDYLGKFFINIFNGCRDIKLSA